MQGKLILSFTNTYYTNRIKQKEVNTYEENKSGQRYCCFICNHRNCIFVYTYG